MRTLTRGFLPCLLVFGLACGGLLTQTSDFRAVVDAPAIVTMGEPFTVRVTVHNTADKVQILDSLDVADEWLEGVTVTVSTPPYTRADHVPLDNTWSYIYETPIPPGGSVEVVLEATGTQIGAFKGEVDVCVGGVARFNSYPLATTVEPGDVAAPPPDSPP